MLTDPFGLGQMSGAGRLMKVHCSFSGVTAATIFSYYSDELTFSEQEFISLTVEQARELRHRRDMEYLSS